MFLTYDNFLLLVNISSWSCTFMSKVKTSFSSSMEVLFCVTFTYVFFIGLVLPSHSRIIIIKFSPCSCRTCHTLALEEICALRLVELGTILIQIVPFSLQYFIPFFFPMFSVLFSASSLAHTHTC